VQYGELPEHIRINDTDVIFEGEDKENQEYFDFDDIAGELRVLRRLYGLSVPGAPMVFSCRYP
jgi:hypothetical protein